MSQEEAMGNKAAPPYSGVGRKARIDGIGIIILMGLIFGLSAHFQLFNGLYDWIGEFEEYHIEEIFIVLMILPLAFILYARRRNEDLLREQEEGRKKDELSKKGKELNRIILNTLSEAIIIFDGSGQIIHVNGYAENILGIYRNTSDGNLYIRGDLEMFNGDGSRMSRHDWGVSRAMREGRAVINDQLGIMVQREFRTLCDP